MKWLRGMLARREPTAPSPPPAAAPDWQSLGNAALAAGDLAEAVRCYRQGVLASPQDAALRLNLGFALLQQGQAAAASELLQQALALRAPGASFVHDAYFLLGQAQRALGHTAQALASFEQAVAAKPDFVEALDELARHAADTGDWERAHVRVQQLRALADTPQHALLAGRVLHALGRYEEARAALAASLAAEPGNAEALEGLGNVLMELKRADEAFTAFQQVLALRGPDAATWSNGASALALLGRLDEALAWTDRALELDPRYRNALHNRSQVLLQALRPAEALQVAQDAARLFPDDADLEWDCALALLMLGDLARGWPAYESRWRAPILGPREPRPARAPTWTGREPLEGRSLLVFSEQGLGDSLQFVRFVAQVARTAGRVYLRIQPTLRPLMTGLPARCEVLAPGAALPPVDFECPLLSLPLCLGTTWENLPREVPYLHADPQRQGAWEERLREPVRRLRVGLAWSGNPAHRMDHKRSVPLALLAALRRVPCQFVSLQKELRPEDAEACRAWPGLLQFGDALRDFGDTAALAAAMDLVISVDTSVAHLAGALGLPVWILLDRGGEWRWLTDREDSPWYPTARLYRQEVGGDWPQLLARVARDLEDRIQAGLPARA